MKPFLKTNVKTKIAKEDSKKILEYWLENEKIFRDSKYLIFYTNTCSICHELQLKIKSLSPFFQNLFNWINVENLKKSSKPLPTWLKSVPTMINEDNSESFPLVGSFIEKWLNYSIEKFHIEIQEKKQNEQNKRNPNFQDYQSKKIKDILNSTHASDLIGCSIDKDNNEPLDGYFNLSNMKPKTQLSKDEAKNFLKPQDSSQPIKTEEIDRSVSIDIGKKLSKDEIQKFLSPIDHKQPLIIGDYKDQIPLNPLNFLKKGEGNRNNILQPIKCSVEK